MVQKTAPGCLVIDGFHARGVLSDMTDYLRMRGLEAENFAPEPGEALYPALQRAFQRVRRDDRPSAVVAGGMGCAFALALAAQLPVERLALLCPDDGDSSPQYRRVRAYALRNAALCAADTLLLDWTGRDVTPLRRLCGRLKGCHVQAAVAGDDLWTNRKEVLKLGVFRFLCGGVLPKSLAENPEMCIIYG